MRPYPGLTGIPTAHPKWESWTLTCEEQRELRTRLEDEPNVKVRDNAKFQMFFSDLVHCCHLYRGWATLADESKPSARIANAREWLASLTREGGEVRSVNVSSVNVFDVRRLQKTRGCDEQAALKMMIETLGAVRVSRGQRPRDEILFLIDGIHQAYVEAFSRDSSTSKEGEFERIVVCALTVASFGKRRSVHPHLDEYRSSAEVVEESSYLDDNGACVVRPRTFAPPRIASQIRKSSI